ncbi:UDP-N-acetylglucosamine transferase subunit [Cadophora gregata]|uniref:UDP-N-acetylglucosamine transferase subunit n=1 Tax=Cadophora gregata TaxID=51156 RepID=UPI0026DD251C|nr:UDP-N-acetylglucosamine transferase subunit [Cadophora gregata]KAK0107168.1 UDP-N-acetylglucosamine transferase subunit [Cadophora gregata]KAK0116853.1 UDP-N-acetylglucosamine transferase subunit [Cadophora gregata f. sp. sojae]
MLSALRLLVAALLILVPTAFLRLLYILPSTSRRRSNPTKPSVSHMVVVLGSGGHTAEMMSLLRDIDPRRYTHRTYIVSSGDSFSTGKALEIERTIQAKQKLGEQNHEQDHEPTKAGETSLNTGTWDVKTVPRARKIHQALYTTPFSSLWCFIGCLRALIETARTSKATPFEFPDVIITNGPATAVMVLLAAMFLKFVAVAPVGKMKTIYVESWARVKTLSLSGKVLLRMGICDRFLVQWEALARRINGEGDGKKRKVDWVGFLVE